ncbi:MAG: response regulator [Anaerolineae bacterium]|nr:response regulator [Anaerolineae bacterium]
MDHELPDTSKADILIVDDTPNNLRLLSQMLSQHGYKVRAVLNGSRALSAVQSTPPDLILLDVMMPEINGYEVCERLKADPKTRDIPIIFISAIGSTEGKVKGFNVGGVDYISKPFQLPEVLVRVETHLNLVALQKELREEVTVRDKLIAELNAYAHTVAHELKNPLGLVIGFAEILAADPTALSQDDLVNLSQRIARNSRRMDEIIDHLLLLASVRGMEAVSITPLNMEALVNAVEERLHDKIIESKAQIIHPQTWLVSQGYGPWVEEVWANYLSNAIKYGGTPPYIEIGATVQDDGMINYWVRDNGEGLIPSEISRLFTPFERLHKMNIKGHGLGLAIVQRIVEKLGGAVGAECFKAGEEAESQHSGCMFYFTLPAVTT